MARKKSRTREARQRRQKQRRKNQRTILLLGIVIVAVVAIAMVVVSNQPVEAFIPGELQARYEGLSRSLSPDGYPQLGDLDAPVTVEEFSSFACPGCEVLHDESFDAMLERIRSGQILFTYVPMQTGSIPNALGAAKAALCAGQQGMFWEAHDVLFDWQTRYANTAYSQNRLLAGVAALGLSESGFTNCFHSATINETLAQAMTEDVTGTPTLRINGVTLEAQAAGSIPSTAEILQAIDDATPNDWGKPSEPETLEEETGEKSEEASQAEADPASDTVSESEEDASPAADEKSTGAPEPTLESDQTAGEAEDDAGEPEAVQEAENAEPASPEDDAPAESEQTPDATEESSG